MMTSLFSIFEPASSLFNIPFNWLSTFIGLLFMPMLYWHSPSRWNFLWSSLMNTLHKELKSLLSHSCVGTTLFFISLFSLIIFNNSLGLLPYIFTSTSHLAATLSFSLPIWLTLMLFGWYKHTQHMFAHLVPMGTPSLLMPFMVVIETISNVIRPMTLAVRLTANMIAGHLLLTLLSQNGPHMSKSTALISILIFSQILLLILESAVAVIQSYVFTVLSTLYTSEIN